ncbi:ABC transporter substrate-binding protein [Corynebacterium freneyi]|uniref:ABC transporter substrate-binding protein n=1 Tax=Corynebacterium freneyi TaxID=134034 RepID=UPI001CCB18DD|nr:ABC transporter substrate-binding protein [Corynebacterium freneyi]UBI03057.1 ABC transporter substrate-binding protein [Corynebacterium freneyi]
MLERQNRRRRTALLGSVAAAVLLSGCMANPGDAPTVGEDEPPREAAARAEESLKQIRVGVDAFGEGFNPHLIADASPVTDLVAALTLPSAFEPDPEDPSRWRMSPDLLESAEIVPVDEPVPDEDAGDGERADGSDADGGSGSGSSSGSGSGTGSDSTGAAEDAAPSIAAEARDADASDARAGDTRIRYRIRSGAQWSDGTPISGADFRYLHASLLANAGVSDAAGYERIKAITVSAGGRQVDVLVDGAMPEWRTLFRNLLPSHVMRPSATPFVDLLDTSLPASGGRYTAQSIDVGRGEVRLVRNDRFWGDVPAKTDTVIVRSVDGSVTGAEQLRAGQLQAVRVRPRQTTALTYGLVPGAAEVSAALPRELTLHANVASPLLDDVAVRRSLFSAVDVGAVAAIATGRTDDLRIPDSPYSASGAAATSGDRAQSQERRGGQGAGGDDGRESGQRDPEAASVDLSGVVDGVSEDNPLLIGVMGEDRQAVAAARAIADQFTAAGLPARVTAADEQTLAGSLLPHGRVDFVVAWNDVVDSPQKAASRWACPSDKRRSTRPTGDARPGASTETTATSAPATPGATSTPGTTSGATTTPEPGEGPGEKTGAAPADIARGSNLSGLCDAAIDEMLDEAVGAGTAGGLGVDVIAPEGAVPARIRDAVDQEAVELGIVVDRVLTVMGSGVELPIADEDATDPLAWPSSPFIGPLMTIPDWRRVPSATTSEVTNPDADPDADSDSGADPNSDADPDAAAPDGEGGRR